MSNPLDEPSTPTPRSSTPVPPQPSTSSGPDHQTLAIEDTPGAASAGQSGSAPEQGAVHTLDLGEGNVVKLDKLGPMIINSDGTLSRIQNWQDLHPIEQERTVRLLVKKRNLVRLERLADQDGGQQQGEGQGEEPLTALSALKSRDPGAIIEK